MNQSTNRPMTSAHRQYLDTRHFGSLDGIRALSILPVIWFHTIEPFGFLPIENRGYLGVDMFFVLSGFLITTLLLREEARRGEISLPKFYARRSLRIFPIYFGLLLVLAIGFATVGSERPMAEKYFYALPFLATYTCNWVHTDTIMNVAWSLAAEEQFYVVWPPVRKFLKRFGWAVLIAVLVVSELINFRVLDPWLASTLGEDFLTLEMVHHTFTPICLGVLLAGVLHTEKGFGTLRRLLGSRWASLACLIAFAAALWSSPADVAGVPQLAFYVLMMLFLASCVVREDHGLAAGLKTRWLVRIGVVSYGIYLYHLFVLHALKAVGVTSEPGLFIFGTLGSWFVAELSYRFFESRFLRIKTRYST